MNCFISLLGLLYVAVTLTCSFSHLQTLRLLSILPYPKPGELAIESVEPSYLEGPTLYLASQLAVDLVNNRSDILPDYHLELIKGDGGCDIRTNVEVALFKHVIYNENVQGVVGPGCSHSTLALGNLTRIPNVYLLSVSLSGAKSLSENYPNSFSALDSSQQYVRAIQKMIEAQNWKNVSVIHDLSRPFFASIKEQLEEVQVARKNITFHFLGLSPGNLRNTPLSSLPLQCQPNSRIVLILAGTELATDISCLLTKTLDYRYPDFQYIIVHHTPESLTRSVNFTYGHKVLNCSSKDIETHLNGSIFLRYRLDALNANDPTSSGLSYNEFSEMYNKSVADYNNQSQLTGEPVEPSVWATAYFDATWALILALNNSREDLREKTGLELQQYKYGHIDATDIVRDHLLQLDFNGVSGRFKFNDNNGFVKRLVDIWQFKDGSAQRLEYYKGSYGNISFYNASKADYIGDSFKYIPISDPVQGGLLLSLIVIVTTIILVVHIISLVNRSYPSVKATNPRLYLFAYFGSYLANLGSVLIIIGLKFGIHNDQARCNIIHSSSVIQNTGLVLVLSALTAISFRVHRIFVHWKHPGRLIDDLYLKGFIIIVTGLFFVTHVALSIVFTPTPKHVCVSTQGAEVSFDVECKYQVPYLAPAYSIPIILLTSLAAILATLSIGHVKIELFKTQPILIVCYLFFVNSGVWIVYYATESSTRARLGPVVGSALTTSSICLIFLFIPPTLPILKDFLSSNLKEHISPFYQKARDLTDSYTSQQMRITRSPSVEKDSVAYIGSLVGAHGHRVYSSSRKSTPGKHTKNGIPSNHECTQVTIVVEEVDL